MSLLNKTFPLIRRWVFGIWGRKTAGYFTNSATGCILGIASSIILTCKMLPRKIFKKVKSHLVKKQITVITGMRRTGKTTILKELLNEISSENKLYLDLERIDNRDIFSEKNYDNVLISLKNFGLNLKEKIYLALDEIQLSPNIPSVMKYLYDHFNIKFLVSGSSSYYLKNLFSESLAGRKKIFELHQLDFGEFLDFKKVSYPKYSRLSAKFVDSEYERIKFFYEEFIRFGGFPEVVLANTKETKRDLLSDILSSYINIDVKNLSDFKNSLDIYSLIKLLASRVGSKVDVSKLASTSNLSRATVQNYLELFEKTYLTAMIPVFTKNADREIVKAKKIYFSDTGLLNFLTEVSSGSQFENAVFNQLKHKGEVRYFSLKNGKEIDFILDQKTAFEVKETPTGLDKKILKKMARDLEIKKSYLIGRHKSKNFTYYLWGGSIR